MPSGLRLIGNEAEQAVAAYLERQGYTIVARNYLVRCGELDIVARKGSVLVFVEVKSRQASYFPISDVITASKQKKIIKAAQYFMLEHKITRMAARFDVAFAHMQNGTWHIDYRDRAFEPEEYI